MPTGDLSGGPADLEDRVLVEERDEAGDVAVRIAVRQPDDAFLDRELVFGAERRGSPFVGRRVSSLHDHSLSRSERKGEQMPVPNLETFRLDLRGNGVLVAAFNRPEVYNAVNQAVERD